MRLLKEEQQLVEVEVEAFEHGGDSLVGFSAMSDYNQSKNNLEKTTNG
jgi:hypothetical protein